MIESDDVLLDYLTGLPRPNIGAETNRQQIEQVLVEEKGYTKSQVRPNVPIRLDIEGLSYVSAVDLVVYVKDHPFMVIKCAAGSLASREKEVIAAGRLLTERQVPLAIASDGRAVLVWGYVEWKNDRPELDGRTFQRPSREDLRALADAALAGGQAPAPAIDFSVLRQHEYQCRQGFGQRFGLTNYSPATSLPQCLQMLARLLTISAQNGHSRVKKRS